MRLSGRFYCNWLIMLVTMVTPISSHMKDKYMLFAGWEVRMVKIWDRGLENTYGLRQHFQDRGHSFSPYRPTLSQKITYLLFLNLTKFFPKEPE